MSLLAPKQFKMLGWFKHPALTSVVFLVAVLSGCDDSTPPPTPTSSCVKSGQSQSTEFSLVAEEALTFQKDILPILSSAKTDEVYKCTFCHAGYSKEETFAEKSKIDNVIAQVEELKMPLNGDEMRKEQIALIKKWRDQKFPKQDVVVTKPINWEETPAQKPESRPSSGC